MRTSAIGSWRGLRKPFPTPPVSIKLGFVAKPDNEVIWPYAAKHGFAIVSKDEDFRRLSFSRGHPPKVIWLVVGKAGTNQVADLLLRNKNRIATFLDDQNEDSLLTLNLNDPDTDPSTR